MNTESFDIAVAGAGVVGVATAYAFARRGLSVALLDSHPGAGRGSSFANGAQLSYAYTDALASPSLARKLPELVLGADPLFRLAPRLDPAFVKWGLRFLANCPAAPHRRNTLAVLKLALESRAAMAHLLEETPLDFSHATAGKMHLYYSDDAFVAACAAADLKARYGAVQEILSPAKAREVEPALAQTSELKGVVHSPLDAVGDPHRFAVELTDLLIRRYQMRTMFDFEIDRLELTKQNATVIGRDGKCVRARTLVVALGADSPRLLRPLGLQPAIMPMKGYSFGAPLGSSVPKSSITDTARKLVFCRLEDRMRIAGGAELGRRDRIVDPARMAALYGQARAAMPEACNYSAATEEWAGLRPMTPDSMPIIARPKHRLIVNVGHGMLGWTLAMGSGERAANLLNA